MGVVEEKRVKLKKSIIDCDIHHVMPENKVKDYLPRAYRQRVDNFGFMLPSLFYTNGGTDGRASGSMADAFPPEGGTPGSSLSFLQSHHLDPFHVEYAILTGHSYSVHSSPDADFAAAVCSAYNQYNLEHWLSGDERLLASIFAAKQDPNLAAKEIDTWGPHSKFVQVIVPAGAEKPYGNRFYDPIYAACVRHDLPFTIHVSMEGTGLNAPPTGAGYVSYYAEYRALRAQVMMAHLASFIYEGTFEKFPTLKVVLQEAGVFWLAPYLWRLDQDWISLRSQTPWVKKRPSEYFRSNVRVTTQPIEDTPNRAMFDLLMEDLNAKETMMFCSDYPHWDFDSPQQALPKLDEEVWDRIFYQNAADLYKLPQRKLERV
ncbi:amidohydrolase family protein [Paenibacillus ferrarius]|uniref:amidohydrolase family protein n=1 Tax=Paenibacillus ferrarius TaxID=1469647 RepID=UPI003D2DC8D4